MIIQEEKVEIVEDQQTEKNLKPVISGNKEFQTVPSNPVNKKHFLVYICAFIGILFLILLIIFSAFTIYNLNNSNNIAKGIYIYGIDISGLSKKQATDKVSSKFKQIQATDIKLFYKDYEAVINPSEINLSFDISSAVNYAFSIGKSGNIFKDDYAVLNAMINGVNVTPSYSLDEKSLQSTLDNLSKNLPNAVKESSYYIEGSNLIITKGSDGFVIDSPNTIAKIKSKLTDLTFLTDNIELSLINQHPKAVNLDEIYKEVHKDAKDAYYTTNPFTVYPSETGIDFKISLEQAKQEVAKAKTEYTIPLKTVYPKVTTNMIGKEAFPDLLAEFSTTYATSKVNRSTNLRIAAEKINGTVLLPGETFSYNKVVGERTISAGFKEAGVYVNGELVDGLGGGVCQISSTVFNCALFANLKITEVYYHPYVSSYVPIGRDATVAYGFKDFKFTNNRNYAIRIECKASGGVATCKIYGLKQNPEYDIKIRVNTTSKTATYTKTSTYRDLYQNGKRVSSEFIYNCTYKKH